MTAARNAMTTDLNQAWQPENFIASDGARICLWRHPRHQPGRPHLHFAHATGLSGLSYRSLLEPLADIANLWTWDMRGHGRSEAGRAGSQLASWEIYYQDLERLIEHIDQPIILAGHSVGGMCSAALASRRPDRVTGLLLVDPVMFSGAEAWAFKLARLFGSPHPLAALAARRRAGFASREAALEAYRGRAIFRHWSEAALQDYVDSAFEAGEDGGIVLRCKPAFESRSFAATELSPFLQLGALPMPGQVLVAAEVSTMNGAARRRWRRRYPHIPIEVVAGSSHMLPFEQPTRLTQAVQVLLSRLD